MSRKILSEHRLTAASRTGVPKTKTVKNRMPNYTRKICLLTICGPGRFLYGQLHWTTFLLAGTIISSQCSTAQVLWVKCVWLKHGLFCSIFPQWADFSLKIIAKTEFWSIKKVNTFSTRHFIIRTYVIDIRSSCIKSLNQQKFRRNFLFFSAPPT